MAVLALLLVSSVSAEPVPAFQNESTASAQNSGQSANSELLFMLEQLRNEMSELRGMVESQGHRLDQLTKQAKDRYIDLDRRLTELSKRPPAPNLVAPAANTSTDTGERGSAASNDVAGIPPSAATTSGEAKRYRSPGKDEEAEYQAIRELIAKKDFDKAIDRLYQFISKYPEGDLTVNAYYWLGEVYLVKPQLEQAKQAFTIVATRYADHRKSPDALYKLGVVADRMGQAAESKKMLEAVLNQYPDSSAASLARAYLDGMSQ